MKILMAFPWSAEGEVFGGAVRARMLAEGFAEHGAKVDFVHFPLTSEAERKTPLFPKKSGIRVLRMPVASQARLFFWLWARPDRTRATWAPRWKDLQREYDIIYYSFPWHFGLFEDISATMHVLDVSQSAADYNAHLPVTAPFKWPWRRLTGAIEAAAYRQADQILVCTEGDAKRLRDLYGECQSAPWLVSNGFPEGRRGPSKAEKLAARSALGLPEQTNLALFLGSDNPFNRQAVRDLQSVAAGLTNWEIIIVGAVGTPMRRSYDTRLRVVGYQEDLTKWLAAADVGLNPVRAGTGSHIALGEMLAAGLPVLTTPQGRRGYPAALPGVTTSELEKFPSTLQRTDWKSEKPQVPKDWQWKAIAGRLVDKFAETVKEKHKRSA